MKRVLIISPHFPPVNAADMHRVRQCLPHLTENGWHAEVVTVDPDCIESYSSDELLCRTIPAGTVVHRVRALPARLTRRFGLGSLSLRSYPYFMVKGDELLSTGRYDLVFFSTTAFHVMALGPRWRRRYGVPFVLDMQDPWRSDFYLDKPKSERPPKFRIAYALDKFLEARTIPFADAIISVSPDYIETFRKRYDAMRGICETIPFGGVPEDFKLISEAGPDREPVDLNNGGVNMVYVGRGGHDMQLSVKAFFKAMAKGLKERPGLFDRVHCWFIGTDYAKPGEGRPTILPLAEEEGMGGRVTEITDRMPYIQTLSLLKRADLLFVPGSTDPSYSASKIYPYILAERPMLAVFHAKSNIHCILAQSSKARVVAFESAEEPQPSMVEDVYRNLEWLLSNRNAEFPYDRKGFEPYTAASMTRRVVGVFERACDAFEHRPGL